MSVLSFAVATAVATPVPSPEVVVHTVTQTVAVTPEWVKQAIELLSLIVPGYVASFLHSVLKGKSVKLQSDQYEWFNAALLFAYSAITAAVVLALEGHLNLHSPDTLAASFLTVLGAASLRYNALKLKQTNDPAPAAVTEAPAQQF